MPGVTAGTVRVTWNTSPTSTEDYDQSDTTNHPLTETDTYVKIWGKLHGSTDDPHWIEITRANTKKIEIF